eukprot:g923.t1
MGARLLELAVRGQRLPRLGSRPVLTGRQRLEQPTAVVEHGAGGDDGARHGFGRGLGKPADPVRHHPGCFGALKLHSSRPPPGTHTCEGQPRPPGGQRLFKEQPFERALCAGEEGQLTLWDLRSSVALCEVKGHEKLIWILRELRLRRHSEAVADSGGHIGRDLSDATEAPGDRGVGRVLPIYYGIHFMVLLSNGQSWSTDFQGSVLMLCTWHGSAPSSNFPAWTVCALLWCWLFAPLPSKLIFWARQSFGHGELYSLTLWSLLVLLGALDEFWHNVFIFTLGLCTCEVALSLPPAKGPYNWFWPVWCDVTLLGFLLLTAKWNYETGLSGLSWGSSFWSGCFAPVAVWSRKIYECDAPRHATLASRFIPLRRAKSGGALPSNAVTVDQLTGRPLVKSSVPEAPRINDARREEVENQFRKLRQSVLIWEVVGGAREGGLVVREGHSLTSTGIRPQLRCGSLVRELADKGERICYQLLQGNGPSAGWVSIKVKKTEMKPSKEGEVQLLIRRLAMLPLPLQKVLNFPVLSCKQITEYIYEPRFFPHDAVLRSMLQDPQLSPVRRCFPGPEGKYMPSMDTWGNVEKDLRTTTLRGAVRFGAQATQSMSRGEPEEDGEFAPGVHGGAEAMLLADAAVYFARLTWRSNAMLKKISCQFSKPCPCFETLEISVNLGLEEESAYNFGGLTAKLDKQLISFAEVALVSFPSKPMRLPADLPPRCALAPPGVDWVPAELAQSRLPKVGKATPYTHDEYMAAAFERPRMAWPSSCAAVEEVGREELERQRGRRKHVRANRPVRQEGDMRNDLCFPGGLTPAAISFEKYFEKALDGIRFEGTLKLGPQSTEALFLTPDGQSVAHPGMALAALDDHLAHLPRCDGREKTSITWKLEMEAHGLLPIGQELSFECFCPFAQTGPVGNVASGTIRYEDQILATLSAVITSSDKNAADALQVPDLEDYWGAHRIVTCDAPVFWVNFSLSGNTKRYLDISAGTLHPASSFSSDRLWDLRVDALVLAPGLPQLDPSTLEIDLPAEVGSFGQLLQSPEDVSTCAHRETQLAVQVRQGLCGYFDNFGAWGVWSSVLLDRHVEVSGDGLVAFWLRGGTTGKFWVMLGTAGPEQEERLCFTVRVL